MKNAGPENKSFPTLDSGKFHYVTVTTYLHTTVIIIVIVITL